MDLLEAQKVIRNDKQTFSEHYLAATTIIGSEDSTLEDLMECLKRGGICAEIGAMRLHTRTGRARRLEKPNLYMEPEDWTEFLRDMDAEE